MLTEEQNQKLGLEAYKLALGALEALLKIPTIPQMIDFYFNDPKVQHLGANVVRRTWPTEFMKILASKEVVQSSGNHFMVKNRFFIESLLKEGKSGSGSLRLMGMVRQAMELPDPNAKPTLKVVPPSVPPPRMEPVNENAGPERESEPEMAAEPEEDLEDLPDDASTKAILERILALNVMANKKINALAENVIYVRDRFEMRQTKLVERVKGLEARLVTIEGKLDIQPQAGGGVSQEDMNAIAEVVSQSVNSMSEVVGSMKGELQKAMESSIKNADNDRLARVQASLLKVTNEFAALRELTLEFLPETVQ